MGFLDSDGVEGIISEFTKAFLTNHYTCHECGAKMEFEDEYEMTLICPECGHECDIDDYGLEDVDEYDRYPPPPDEDEDDEDEDDSGETYDEVCGELSDD